MPRENSFSDSEGRSLTPDLEDELDNGAPVEAHSPTYNSPPVLEFNGQQPKAILQTTVSAPATVSHPQSPHREQRRPTFNNVSPAAHRFRSTVRKVIQLHRASSIISRSGLGFVGAEPGIDPRRESANSNYAHIRQNCVIQIIDYSRASRTFRKMANTEFVTLMADSVASTRESWVKVRWINIGGISWDVISAVAIKYDLHPLAIEDLLHQRSNARSKADYYQKHLFLRMLCHSLGKQDDDSEEETADAQSALTELPRSASPSQMTRRELDKGDDLVRSYELDDMTGSADDELDEDKTVYGNSARSSNKKSRRRPPLFGAKRATGDVERNTPTADGIEVKSRLSRMRAAQLASRRKREQAEITIEELKKGGRVNVKVTPMFIFLLRDGTVISFHSTPDSEFTSPITTRLQQSDTVLRSSADPSLLVQSLLDLIVDQTLEIVDEYHSRIAKLERDVLLKPKMKTVRNLHILSGDLILHKRTLEPVKTVIYGLRRYDVDRCAALIDSSKVEPGFKVEGFMSHKAKIYLADVHDHMEYILTSLDMFAGITENLIDYTFNMASYEMNEVMRRLTMATIIFLPLTLLTGYFGMNFQPMWSVEQNSDVLFWIIALPVMSIVIPLFLYNDILRLFHFAQKKILAKRVTDKVYKRD